MEVGVRWRATMQTHNGKGLTISDLSLGRPDLEFRLSKVPADPTCQDWESHIPPTASKGL